MCDTTIGISDALAQHPSLSLIIDTISGVLLPALTHSQGNGSAFLSMQLWDVLHLLPFQIRYDIYEIWYGGKLGKAALASGWKPLDTIITEAKALHGSKASLKRLAKENTKVIGRQIARFTHYAPLVVLEHIMAQIEHYDNLIPYIIVSQMWLEHATECFFH